MPKRRLAVPRARPRRDAGDAVAGEGTATSSSRARRMRTRAASRSRIRVLGAVAPRCRRCPPWRLSFARRVSGRELPSLIAAERPDVLWFPAQVPETFAYTLSSAIASGLPIVASNLGALPERLDGRIACARSCVGRDACRVERSAARDRAAARRDRVASVRARGRRDVLRDRYLAPVALAAFGRRSPRSSRATSSAPAGCGASRRCRSRRSYDGRRRLRAGAKRAPSSLRRTRSRRCRLRAICASRSDARRDTRTGRTATSLRRGRASNELETSTTLADDCAGPRRSARCKITAARGRAAPRRTAAAAAPRVARDDAAARRRPARAGVAHLADKLRGGARVPSVAADVVRQAEAIAPLTFAPAIAPKVSIVIPVYGKPLLTFTCLQSVARAYGRRERSR